MLWIVAQDNKSFVNVNEVTVDGKKVYGVFSGTSLNEWKLLGKYDSTERALDILAEIVTKMEGSTAQTVTFRMSPK